ncbi:hypothetical protein L2725_00995 [Shewanella corallii]|uniref:Uncharacterized protein n=1 Tax=Shewanella corallii TaxID=560080 RepID=A0ABT0N1T7_9GAMM|nr:hypothetical protein [Shewanella corallii]MCL2912371.1 hypothetical protein [Shewanella corallii]
MPLTEYKPMNKVVYVPAHFQQLAGKAADAWSKKKSPKESDAMVDGERLSQDTAAAVEALNAEGYEVQSIMPITSGNYNFAQIHGSGSVFESGGYGYGYSFTQGVTIIGRRIAEQTQSAPEPGLQEEDDELNPLPLIDQESEN